MNGAVELLNPTAAHVRQLPGRGSGGQGYAYVVEFDSGWIKVGRTTNPRSRINYHVAGHPLADQTVTRLWLSHATRDYIAIELRLIGHAQHACTDRARREYFSGCVYADLVAVATTSLTSTARPAVLMGVDGPKKRQASALLEAPVAEWIRERRPHTSWRHISAELSTATGGQVDVPLQTLINWAPDPTT